MINEYFTYTNARGQSIILGNNAPFILLNHNGADSVSTDVQMQKAPFQDGKTHIDSVLDTRTVELQFVIIGTNETDLFQRRTEIASVFNPKLGAGTLTYHYPLGVREIKAVPEGTPFFPSGEDNRGATFQQGLITLNCPSPFWESLYPENYKLEDFVGNFRFAFRFPVRFSTRGDGKTLINKGDVQTPVRVEFRGPVINPKVTNQATGEFIKVNAAIPENFKLIIDTTFGNKRVDIIAPDGVVTNGFHFIDLESSFFNLDVGETRFSFITDGGNAEVYVEYKHRYLSV